MTAPAIAETGAPPPVTPRARWFATVKRRWPMAIGFAITAAMVVGLGHQLADAGLPALARSVPGSFFFYLAFLAYYMAPPYADYLIFRRLWDVPLAGLGALLRKRIANDVVLGYSGEAYFYAWARTHARQVAAPFGAVKDVSILSAIAGNAITLAMVVVATPFARSLLTPAQFHASLLGAGVMLGTSVPFVVFGRRVFSLSRAELWWVFGVQCARVLASAGLLAVAWHFALPDIAIGTWAVLVAAKQLVSRLPLVPNKDLLFANMAVLLIGRGAAVSHLVALVTAATLVLHLLLVVGFGVHHLFSRSRVEPA